jgi:hypothetical protein
MKKMQKETMKEMCIFVVPCVVSILEGASMLKTPKLETTDQRQRILGLGGIGHGVLGELGGIWGNCSFMYQKSSIKVEFPSTKSSIS